MNLVNGMIVDGLGHVSLDSGAPGSALANNTLSQANIHQGKNKDTFKYCQVHFIFRFLFKVTKKLKNHFSQKRSQIR